MAWVVKRSKQCRVKVTYPPKTKYKLKGYSYVMLCVRHACTPAHRSWKSRLRYLPETEQFEYTRPGRKRKRRKKGKEQMRRLKTPAVLTSAYGKVLRKYGFKLQNS